MAVKPTAISLDSQSPERLLLTRLFTAQRRLRYIRSMNAALNWFAIGTLGATCLLILLWNWNRLPGPWQWLAAAGRPRELLWLPLLTALGGFFSHWFVLPKARQSAYGLDKILDSQERLLTAVDWILSEKPRTARSEKLLQQAASLVSDEGQFRKDIKKLESVGSKRQSLLFLIAIPLALLYLLPAHIGLPPSTNLWLGEGRVDQLTENLLKELEQSGPDQKPEEKLEDLLKKLEQLDSDAKTGDEEKALKRELQRAIDQMKQEAEAQEKTRELLETLAQRAREGQTLSEKDKDALEALRQSLEEKTQREGLLQAQKSWQEENFEEAAENLESLQKEMGESAEHMSEAASKAESEAGLEQNEGQEFNEKEGDQFGQDGRAKDGKQGEGQGQGEEQGQGQGDGEGREEGEGRPGGQAGKGTTLEEEKGTAADGRQSLRRGEDREEWLEEYRHLHPPERTEFQKSQTRVQGETNENGPRFRTAKEGRGAVTTPSDRQGSGGLLEYREEAENAILRDQVPAEYRDNVRLYFESLDQAP